MRIRPYSPTDLQAIVKMHRESGLPMNCLPDLRNTNFKVKVIADHRGKPIVAGFVKQTAEGFILIDHSHATPQERLEALETLVAFALGEAAKQGFTDLSAWLPPEVEKAFGLRLQALGFIRSPWSSYTALLE